MSRKRKKNSRNPARPEVTFLRIYEPDENPWPQEYYMCGMCGHAIAAKDVSRHATKNHNASSLRLLEVDDTEITEEEAAELRGQGLLSSKIGDHIAEPSQENGDISECAIDES